MDTISRESSPSYLPIAGLIAGLVGLLLGGIALANASKAKTAAATAQTAADAQVAKIGELESSVSSAQRMASDAQAANDKTVRDINNALGTVATELGKVNGEIVKLQEAATKTAAPKGTTKTAGPVVAGPDEYVIKSGDTFAKVARAQGVSLADIQAVNPGVDPSKLKVGQKIKLPKK